MGDLLRLRWSDKEGDMITKIRQKTSDTNTTGLPILIYLWPEAEAIINKYGNPDNEYIFDVLSSAMTEVQIQKAIENRIKTVNKYMKRVVLARNDAKQCFLHEIKT